MDITATLAIDDFLTNQQEIFTADEFYRFLKSKNVKVTKDFVSEILNSSNMVFPLVNNEYVTRAGVFLNRCFSFKPTKEEVKKGYFIIGHRLMPFINPEVAPDNISVTNGYKVLKSTATSFTMNTAMDIYALYGEGYVIPYIFNDHSNTKVPLSSVQYSMPTEIDLTSWPLKEIALKKDFKYGDRILCRVVNWEENIVHMQHLPKNDSDDEDISISQSDIEREEWYIDFEKGLIQSFKKNGPCNSIEEQLAYLFLENQERLCNKNCGSAEEFLAHTKKISFCPYGVETRIWKTGETVPYNGEWNESLTADTIFNDLTMIFSPQVIDAYIENYLYLQEKNNKKESTKVGLLIDEIFPAILKMPDQERKFLMLNIEKRHDILKKSYNIFSDYKLAPVRNQVINLFSKVTELACSIGCSGLKISEFPQQELIILVQLFGHISKMIEEMENVFIRDQFPVDDVLLSLEGMEETFTDIRGTLQSSIDVNTYKNIKLVDDKEN